MAKTMSHSSSGVRVRFAPSPTGWMHLGSVRTALLNALYARKSNGVFVLRIEDTDANRMIDPEGKKICEDMAWLKLEYDEGPFHQSKRHDIYLEHFKKLEQSGHVYRCFETAEELEAKRQRQIALGLPPRYDRASLKLSQAEVDAFLAEKKPFIWRFKLPTGNISFTDLAHGEMTFDLSNFSDFAITRQDGTFTFMFVNAIDDIVMNITHALRGEDHLTNTVTQIPIFHALGAKPPIYYHLPLICNSDGKKLSKRDFGFSLEDLKKGGFLPEAINNYLAILGASFEHEIMDFETLVKTVNFDRIHGASGLRYDVDKLRWVNHQWLQKLSTDDIAERALPFLLETHPESAGLDRIELARLIKLIQPELTILLDVVTLLAPRFQEPALLPETHAQIIQHRSLIEHLLEHPDVNILRNEIKQKALNQREVFGFVRQLLTGRTEGLGLAILFELLGTEEVKRRFKAALKTSQNA